jgi:predicted amidophosphoribosyltransferase
MKCSRCQHANRPRAKFCEECGTPVQPDPPVTKSYEDLNDEVEGLQ